MLVEEVGQRSQWRLRSGVDLIAIGNEQIITPRQRCYGGSQPLVEARRKLLPCGLCALFAVQKPQVRADDLSEVGFHFLLTQYANKIPETRDKAKPFG